MRAFRKKELRLLRPPEPGEGSARYSATHRCKDYSSFTALAHTVRIGVAILLSGVRPPQRLHSKSAKRYHVQTSHTHSLTLDYSVRFVEILEKISSHQYRIINYYQSNNNAKRREEPIGHQTKQSLSHLISFFWSSDQDHFSSSHLIFTRLQSHAQRRPATCQIFAKIKKYIIWPLPGQISPCYTRLNPF